MKTILFPTDFSANALHAAHYAGMLAKLMHANLILLNVYSIPTLSEYQLPADIEEFIIKNRKDAEAHLQHFTAKVIAKTSLSPDRIIQKAEYGIASEKIVSIANTMKTTMIVMGTKGAHNTLERWLGTHAQQVMCTAPCPVWVVPADAPIHYPKEIMYAADFREDEVAATQKLLEITKPLNADCKIVHVHDYFEINVGHAIEEMVNYLENTFEKDAVSVKNLHRSSIIEGLETYINTHKPAVLALAIHDKPLLDRLFNASVTKHFVQAGKLPILLFKK